ncbi:hypothetical protein V1503_09295 [Bacillus sp. SCS-151]|uniref:hypothetical protein n=1 Tax=Nanhaiella sioensis TaxID=3115293 RepID=UPI00397BE332
METAKQYMVSPSDPFRRYAQDLGIDYTNKTVDEIEDLIVETLADLEESKKVFRLVHFFKMIRFRFHTLVLRT